VDERHGNRDDRSDRRHHNPVDQLPAPPAEERIRPGASHRLGDAVDPELDLRDVVSGDILELLVDAFDVSARARRVVTGLPFVSLIQVADAFRAAHRPFPQGLAALEAMPMANAGCIAYDALDVNQGCVHNVNGIVAAYYSRIGHPYAKLLAYEEQTILPSGAWYYDEALPQQGPQDAGHQAWEALMLLDSPDPAMRALGHRAALYVEQNFQPETEPVFAGYAVAATSIQDGNLAFGCPIAKALPALQLDAKNMMWAAYVYTWAQTRGC
jgi:hypothetical protein